jgi:RNA polymerase sigma-70 factor (ECF subfamily)
MIAQTTTHGSLLARLAVGSDSSAWGDFLDRYGDLIHRFAARRGLQPADADDVTQEVLLSLTRSMPGFHYDPEKGKFRSYLKTVVLRAVIRKSRQNDREFALEEIEAAVARAADDAAIDDVWENEWRQHHLRQAMRAIGVEFNSADRAAFARYAVEGRSAQEAAASLGMTVDQVYQAKSRILKRIGQLIEQQVRDEG